jgi:hypothetical protein
VAIPSSRDTDIATLQAILAGRFEFPSDATLSEDARSLVQQLLVTDSIGRLSAKGALREPWLVER